MIYQLDKIAPGTANYDTLLYGAEVKFYSARLPLSSELETALPGFFAAGDGAGVTRGLAHLRAAVTPPLSSPLPAGARPPLTPPGRRPRGQPTRWAVPVGGS